MRRWFSAALVFAACAVPLAGCGSGDNSVEDVTEEELQQEEREAEEMYQGYGDELQQSQQQR